MAKPSRLNSQAKFSRWLRVSLKTASLISMVNESLIFFICGRENPGNLRALWNSNRGAIDQWFDFGKCSLPVLKVTLRPKDGLPMIVRRRIR
jgi:hypothetical protein